MRRMRDVRNYLWGVISVISLTACVEMRVSASQTPGYPPQERFSFDPPFERGDLKTMISPASPEQVTRTFGTEFASLPRLGVLLVLVNNKGRPNPIAVSRQSIRLILPDGRVLKPLEPSELIAWFEEAYGSAARGRGAMLGEEARMNTEKGVLRVLIGDPQGAITVFRFPQGVLSGTFPVEYVLDLGAGEQVAVKQRPHLNLRP